MNGAYVEMEDTGSMVDVSAWVKAVTSLWHLWRADTREHAEGLCPEGFEASVGEVLKRELKRIERETRATAKVCAEAERSVSLAQAPPPGAGPPQ